MNEANTNTERVKGLEKLKQAAQAATPGPWVTDSGLIGHKGSASVKKPGSFDWVCSMQKSNQHNWRSDADFIAAANPAVVLALIDRLDRAERIADAHDDLVKALKELLSDEGYDKWDAEQIDYEESVGRGIAPTIRLAHAALAKAGAA